jgi:hypothetical protein
VLFSTKAAAASKLPYSLPLDETAGEQDERRVIDAMLAGGCARRSTILDPVAHHPYAVTDRGTIFGQQLTLVLRQRHNKIGRSNKVRLGFPLAETFRWSLPQLILGTVQRVYRVDERDTGAGTDRPCQSPQTRTREGG